MYAIVLSSLLVLSSLHLIICADKSDYQLTIIHANDLLSAFAGVQSDNTFCDVNTHSGQCFGGAHRIVSKVRELRSKGHRILFVNTGCNLGGFWWEQFGPRVAIELMRELQFNVLTLGLCDFAVDNHDEQRENFANITDFISNVNHVSRIVSCNLDVPNSAINHFHGFVHKSTVLLNLGKRQVGVIGFVAKPSDPSHYPSVSITDPIRCLQKEVESLRKRVDVIVAIGNGDSQLFNDIANSVPNIDVVIGGYALSKNVSILHNRAAQTYPDSVVNGMNGKVIVATADVFGKSIGNISVSFNSKGIVESYSGNLIGLDSTITSDPNTERIINEYQQRLTIGSTNVYLNGESCDYEECNLANVITDSYVYYRINIIKDDLIRIMIRENGSRELLRRIDDERDIIGVTIAKQIATSIGFKDAVDLKTLYYITKGNLHKLLADSQSKLELYILSGKALRQLFETTAAKYDTNQPSKEFLQVSGVKIVYDLSKPVGERVTHLSVKCIQCSKEKEEYYPINETKLYEVIMPSSIDVKLDEKYDKLLLNVKESSCIEQYIITNSPIRTNVEDRIAFWKPRKALIPGTTDANTNDGLLIEPHFIILLCMLSHLIANTLKSIY